MVSEARNGKLYRCQITDAAGNVVYSDPAEIVLGADTWEFTYDADGMRTKRTNGTDTYTYVYNGGLLSQMTKGTDTLRFAYDAAGTPMTVTHNGTVYYYVTNLQGDVIAILNTSGTAVVRYTYDAWGNPLTTTGSKAETLGKLNPLRYRSYVYDQETGLYYVSSRYYDPEIERFINADTIDILTATPMGLTDKNLYAYCDNNPVVRVDRGGQFWETVFDVVSLGASIVEVCVNPTDPWAWAGLAGDAIDLIPFVTGVGEVTRAVKTVNKVADVVDDVAETADTVYDVSKHVDFYVTPDGDAIPSTLSNFNDNLSKMENINGKYYGHDSRGPVRVRVEMHEKKLGFDGPLSPYHELPHFHIDRKSKVTSGRWIEKFTDFLGRLF